MLSSFFFFLQSFHQKSHLEFTINNSNKKEDQVLLTSILKAPASIHFRDSNCVNTDNAHLRHFPIEAMKCLLNIFRKMCCFTTLYVALELCKLLYPYDQRQTLHVAVAIALKQAISTGLLEIKYSCETHYLLKACYCHKI